MNYIESLSTRQAQLYYNALKKARKKIAHKQNWTQGAKARDRYNNEVDIRSKKAVRWWWL